MTKPDIEARPDMPIMTLLKRQIGVIVFVLAIPVFVWRQGEITYATLSYIAFAIAMAIVRERLTRGEPLKTVNENVDRIEKATLLATAIGIMGLPLVALYTPLIDFALYRPTMPAFVVGVITSVAGIYVIYRAHADLGRFWSVTLEIRETHELVTTGIYAHMRHPMYTSIFLVSVGQALLLENWLAGFAGLAAFTMLYLLRVDREERLMKERFGDAYTHYAARTPRLIPSLRIRN